MLSNDSIANIPVDELTQPNRTLVAIWCTNAPSMIQAVKDTILPKWKLKLLATWYWIKVLEVLIMTNKFSYFEWQKNLLIIFANEIYIQITKFGEVICDFSLPLKKQPFERIFIACHENSTNDFNIPDEKLIFSVPSAIHSHKPPLQGTKNFTQ